MLRDDQQYVGELAHDEQGHYQGHGHPSDARRQYRGRRKRIQSQTKFFKTEKCHFYPDRCRAGDECRYAHGIEELRTRPDRQKASFCQEWIGDSVNFSTPLSTTAAAQDRQFSGAYPSAHSLAQVRDSTAQYADLTANDSARGSWEDSCVHERIEGGQVQEQHLGYDVPKGENVEVSLAQTITMWGPSGSRRVFTLSRVDATSNVSHHLFSQSQHCLNPGLHAWNSEPASGSADDRRMSEMANGSATDFLALTQETFASEVTSEMQPRRLYIF
eukprot:TRINITY_DN41050_c0_g1_i1.p1 TRINITY_DN41050_c0_g1~~TRINITY_DN41050_c0_g1_i1.p1  ORF type:complete len:273 (-),score=24.15 TRINITY_DN41050_c0_g1_i1:124-942(-)